MQNTEKQNYPVQLPFTTLSQETKWAYSQLSRAHTGQNHKEILNHN